MRTADFDFILPPELIAQRPTPSRDQSRLLVLNRAESDIKHRKFLNFPDYLCNGDVLVLNNSRVIPARLRGTNQKSGGDFEMLLIEENGLNVWWAMLRPGKKAKPGTKILLATNNRWTVKITATVTGVNDEGHRLLEFSGTPDIRNELDRIGEVPLPPYIERTPPDINDMERYQTIFARSAGSAAAPTAGLHFTAQMLEDIRKKGVQICYLTLHVGPGTFQPVKTQTLTNHQMHAERFELGGETVCAVNAARAAGRKVFAVGTTTLRVLESVGAKNNGKLNVDAGKTNIFIFPPFRVQIVDALLTNFHLPRSTLLMLVSAFAAPAETRGVERVLSAYSEAIRERYRFFSYGDAMLIL